MDKKDEDYTFCEVTILPRLAQLREISFQEIQEELNRNKNNQKVNPNNDIINYTDYYSRL